LRAGKGAMKHETPRLLSLWLPFGDEMKLPAGRGA
jgi:hypothetical protein